MVEQELLVDVWDLINWYSTRKLEFLPGHFVRVSTPITPDSLFWIESNLKGRYTLITTFSLQVIANSVIVPAFENPEEATIYELTWS